MMMQTENNTPIQRAGSGRLTLLLTNNDWRDETPLHRLPHLLSPMGIECIDVGNGEEAAEVIQNVPVHIAVVDLTTPLRSGEEAAGSVAPAGAARILQLLRRLEPSPPTVVVRPCQPTRRKSARELSQSLRDGAFAVLDRPVQLETMLEVMRRVLSRHYEDSWPTQSGHCMDV